MSQKAVEILIENFKRHHWTLGFAESCTGGQLSSRFTAVPGVSTIFVGSVVSYSNQIKENLLSVNPHTLKTKGAVSQEVALEMAKGAKHHLQVDWAIGVTGIAGPTGGTPEKPVGTVWIAIVGPNFVRTEKKVFAGDRQHIQSASVDFAVEMLAKAVNE